MLRQWKAGKEKLLVPLWAIPILVSRFRDDMLTP